MLHWTVFLFLIVQYLSVTCEHKKCKKIIKENKHSEIVYKQIFKKGREERERTAVSPRLYNLITPLFGVSDILFSCHSVKLFD